MNIRIHHKLRLINSSLFSTHIVFFIGIFCVFFLSSCGIGISPSATKAKSNNNSNSCPTGKTWDSKSLTCMVSQTNPNVVSSSSPQTCPGYTSTVKNEAMKEAILSGNAFTGPTIDDFIDETKNSIIYASKNFNPIITQLYNLNSDGTAKNDGTSLTSIDWEPTWDTAIMSPTLGVNIEVLLATHYANGNPAVGKVLAIAGETDTKARYFVIGSNPFRTVANAQMNKFMQNTISWLTGKQKGTPIKIVMLQLDESYYFMDESKTRTWFNNNHPTASYNIAKACDGSNFSSCLASGADLVIVSQEYNSATQNPNLIRDSIQNAMNAGVPVLYIQKDGHLNELGKKLFDLFKVKHMEDNYWSDMRTKGFDGREITIGSNSANYGILQMLDHLKSGSYSFALSTSQTPAEINLFKTEFQNGADMVRNTMTSLDLMNQDIFLSCGNETTKLLALLGDRIRKNIVFPMSTALSNQKEFLQSLYADHAVYNSRKINPAQPDLGNFSRTDFSTITPTTRLVNLISRPDFQATGAYALPGHTVKVTRLDSNNVSTHIFVNSVRSMSTHVWDDSMYGGYSRPKFLQSEHIPIEKGKTIYFTNPYGGPIQVGFDTKDIKTQFLFEDIGEHAYWSGPKDDSTFAAKLSANEYDWVEVVTDGFQIHSKLNRFVDETINSPHWNTPKRLSDGAMRYSYNLTHVLAGFQGDGIDKINEIYGWASARGMVIPTLEKVLHMNADQPSCGYGCAGNPYDAGWAYSPIGHGDLHEIGHGLEIDRFLLKHGSYKYPLHASTNFYSYYALSKFYEDTGEHPSDAQGVPFKDLFLKLQESYQNGDRVGMFSTAMETYFSNILAGGGDDGIFHSYGIYLQTMMMARSKGTLTNGFHMMGRIHAVERTFNAAKVNQTEWDTKKSTFGFSTVSYTNAQSMSNNDFMAIAMSFTTGMDLTDYFDMWGLKVSPFAVTQIKSYGFPVTERAFFALKDTQWVEGALSTKNSLLTKINIDGTTPWPLP